MTTYLNVTSLPFWTPEQVSRRAIIIDTVKNAVPKALTTVNKAWTFHQIDGPQLTPQSFISPEYGADDIFITQIEKGGQPLVLRAETTPSSYKYARDTFRNKKNFPACVWQVGKSFRVESSDGARAATLRYNEFYQMEFQCIYADDTKADYRTPATQALRLALEAACLGTTRLVDSDRKPSYSAKTVDIEMVWNGAWKELASISTRTDYDTGYEVLELALGVDRAVMLAENNYRIRQENM